MKKENKEGKKKSKWMPIIIIAVIIIIIAYACGKTSSSSDSAKTANSNDTATTSEASSSAAQSEKTSDTEEVESETKKYDTTLTSGNYTAGTDIPAGTYNITAISGSGNVYTSNMYSGGLNAAMGVGDADTYEKEYKNVDISDGVTLSVSGGVKIKIKSKDASAAKLKSRNQSIKKTVKLSSGNYVAGKDFDAGTYDIEATSGSGNVSSDNMYDGGLNAVMSKTSDELYEKSYKNVDLPDGTTLTISGVKIKLTPSK